MKKFNANKIVLGFGAVVICAIVNQSNALAGKFDPEVEACDKALVGKVLSISKQVNPKGKKPGYVIYNMKMDNGKASTYRMEIVRQWNTKEMLGERICTDVVIF